MSAAFALMNTAASHRQSRIKSVTPYALWATQGLLAALFVFAGVMKFVMSPDDMTKDIDWPIAFLYFIGVSEVLGGFGLILPGITRIQRRLTPIAAAGLAIIMVGAVVSTAVVMGIVPALYPLVVGILLLAVIKGRWNWLNG